MPRPRKADSRDYQINVRFSASEYVRVHAHAVLTGKSVADFARTVLLRRPRRRTPGIQPTVIALAEDAITEWQVLGARLNTIAHLMNAHDALPPGDLGPLLAQLRDLFTTSFALIPDDCGGTAHVLAPAARHHLRKVAVNLAQIRRRFEQLGLQTPNLLVRLLERARAILNADQAPHAP